LIKYGCMKHLYEMCPIDGHIESKEVKYG